MIHTRLTGKTFPPLDYDFYTAAIATGFDVAMPPQNCEPFADGRFWHPHFLGDRFAFPLEQARSPVGMKDEMQIKP